ncbi:MAG: zinc-ribbon domain-containing protein [Pseudomonadota bacterium]
MRIKCPSCATQYEIPDEAIPAAGRVVQCGNCHTSWHQTPAVEATGGVVPFAAPAEAPLADDAVDAENLRALLSSTVEEPAVTPDDARIDAERVFDYDDTKKFEYVEEAPEPVAEPEPMPDVAPAVEPEPVAEADPEPEEAPEPDPAAEADPAPEEKEEPAGFDLSLIREADPAPEADETPSRDDEPTSAQEHAPTEEPVPAVEERAEPEEAPQPAAAAPEEAAPEPASEPALTDDAFEEMKARRAERRARKRAFFDEVRAQRDGHVVSPETVPEPEAPAADTPLAEAATQVVEEDNALDNLRDMMRREEPEAEAPAPEPEPARPARPKRERPPRPSDIAPDVTEAAEPAVAPVSPTTVDDPLPTSMAALRAAGDPDAFSLDDEEPTSRRALGFALAIMLFAIAFGIYVTAPAIAQFAPVLAPALEAYVLFVDQLRVMTEQGFAQARALFVSLIG